jgi:hypothetical protein
MGFHKRNIDYNLTLKYLFQKDLKKLYSKSDAFIFDDELSSEIFELFSEGKTEDEIIELYKNKKYMNEEIGISEKVCYNCKYLVWMIGIGQGLKCSNEKKEQKMESIPSMRHTCEFFKPKESIKNLNQ